MSVLSIDMRGLRAAQVKAIRLQRELEDTTTELRKVRHLLEVSEARRKLIIELCDDENDGRDICKSRDCGACDWCNE